MQALVRGSARPAPDVPELATAILEKGSKTFHLASRFLPRSRRADAAVVYAFCRRADDLADERSSDEAARDQLDGLRRQLEGTEAPVREVAAFLELCARRGIEVGHALSLLDGVRSDVGPVRIADDRALARYCFQVAGTVGLMMSKVIGVTSPKAPPFAVDLGIAMQLTNICRDVAEDAQADRVYLPTTLLRHAGLDPDSIVRGETVDRSALAQVVRTLLARAERLYESADLGMRFIPWVPRMAILAAARMYRAIGHELWQRGADPLGGRTMLSQPQRWLIATRAIFGLFSARALGLWGSRRDPSLHRHLSGLLLEEPQEPRGRAQDRRVQEGAHHAAGSQTP